MVKWPQSHSIYWDIEDTRVAEYILGCPMAYCYMTRDANHIMGNMARWTLEAQATNTFWNVQVPKDAPGNWLQDVYKQQGKKPQLDWVDLPEPFDWKLYQPNCSFDSTVVAVLSKRSSGKSIPTGLLSLSCGMLSARLQPSFMRWSVYLSGWLANQIRPSAQLIW